MHACTLLSGLKGELSPTGIKPRPPSSNFLGGVRVLSDYDIDMRFWSYALACLLAGGLGTLGPPALSVSVFALFSGMRSGQAPPSLLFLSPALSSSAGHGGACQTPRPHGAPICYGALEGCENLIESPWQFERKYVGL